MAYTASVGRRHFAYRAGLVFRDVASLREGLEAVAAGEAGSGPATEGGAEAVSATGEVGGAEEVARAYEAGATVDFAGLYAEEDRRRIALPGYPFERRRFWVQPKRAR